MKKYNLPYINKQVETVILANGTFPCHAIPTSILQNCQYLVCCDGAINNLSETDIEPDAIVEDCDSLDEKLSKYQNIIQRISEQETNDLTKAVQFCLKQGRKAITILGATGKREDHTIANISLLCDYMKEVEVEMITDHGIFVSIDTDSSFISIPKQQVSIFCIDKQPISSQGLVYPINNQIFTNLWQATLNESIDNEFIIYTKGRTIIYRNFSD